MADRERNSETKGKTDRNTERETQIQGESMYLFLPSQLSVTL